MSTCDSRCTPSVSVGIRDRCAGGSARRRARGSPGTASWRSAAYSRRARKSVIAPTGSISAAADRDQDAARGRERDDADPRPAHGALRQTTVCMARFSRRSNSTTGQREQLSDEVRNDRAVEIQPAPLQHAKGRAREQIEVGGERAVGEVVDHLETGLADGAQQAVAIEEDGVLRRLQPGPAIGRTTGRCGYRAAALR